MKKMLSLLLLSVLLMSTTAFAADSGYRFDANELGLSVIIQEDWMEAVSDRTLSFFARDDETVAQNGINGYALILLTPDLTGYSGFDTYDEAEAWLKDHATVLGGVISYDATQATMADTDQLFPEFTKRTDVEKGDTGFVAFTTETAQSFPDAAHNKIAVSVNNALYQPATIFELTDANVDFGVLGEFHTETLTGEHYDNANIAANKLTLVNFWGTYCDPCLSEMPMLGEVAAKYADKGVGFLGIVVDASDDETVELARLIASETGANFPHIQPVVSAQIMGSIQYIPTTILLDSNGQMVGEMHVGTIDEATLTAWIDGALG